MLAHADIQNRRCEPSNRRAAAAPLDTAFAG